MPAGATSVAALSGGDGDRERGLPCGCERERTINERERVARERVCVYVLYDKREREQETSRK